MDFSQTKVVYDVEKLEDVVFSRSKDVSRGPVEPLQPTTSWTTFVKVQVANLFVLTARPLSTASTVQPTLSHVVQVTCVL